MVRLRIATVGIVLVVACVCAPRDGVATAESVPQAAAKPTPSEADLFAKLRSAADQGNPDAQFKLGGVYYAGTAIVKKDFAEAAKWFRRAALQGHAGAEFCLGAQLAAGEGVAQDSTEAAKWFGLAASQGDAPAQIPSR